jgi:hypothetical protein
MSASEGKWVNTVHNTRWNADTPLDVTFTSVAPKADALERPFWTDKCRSVESSLTVFVRTESIDWQSIVASGTDSQSPDSGTTSPSGPPTGLWFTQKQELPGAKGAKTRSKPNYTVSWSRVGAGWASPSRHARLK